MFECLYVSELKEEYYPQDEVVYIVSQHLLCFDVVIREDGIKGRGKVIGTIIRDI